jgi:dihydropteroate synthase
MPFTVRSRFTWRLHGRSVELGRRTIIVGILNVTPDSFSDGGAWLTPASAVGHALEMLDQGADIIDIGGESTRPNAVPVSPADEQMRVLPVLRAILHARPEALLSIDTYHAETARLAVEAGANIVNDVSGHLWDPEMSKTCAELRCGVVLMHTHGRPGDWRNLSALPPGQVIPMVVNDLKLRAASALAAGIAHESIVLDPGFGFGKAFDENFPMLGHIDQLRHLVFPVLSGVSRKGFLGRALTEAGVPGGADKTGEAISDATTAANTAAILGGAHLLRVHDVSRARAAATIADRILETSG